MSPGRKRDVFLRGLTFTSRHQDGSPARRKRDVFLRGLTPPGSPPSSSIQREHRPTDAAVFEMCQVDCRQAGRVHLDDVRRKRHVGRLVGDGRLHHQDPRLTRIDAQARELPQAEGRRPQRVQHQRVRAVDLDDGARALVVIASAAVARLRFEPAAVVQRADLAAHARRVRRAFDRWRLRPRLRSGRRFPHAWPVGRRPARRA